MCDIVRRSRQCWRCWEVRGLWLWSQASCPGELSCQDSFSEALARKLKRSRRPKSASPPPPPSALDDSLSTAVLHDQTFKDCNAGDREKNSPVLSYPISPSAASHALCARSATPIPSPAAPPKPPSSPPSLRPFECTALTTFHLGVLFPFLSRQLTSQLTALELEAGKEQGAVGEGKATAGAASVTAKAYLSLEEYKEATAKGEPCVGAVRVYLAYACVGVFDHLASLIFCW